MNRTEKAIDYPSARKMFYDRIARAGLTGVWEARVREKAAEGFTYMSASRQIMREMGYKGPVEERKLYRQWLTESSPRASHEQNLLRLRGKLLEMMRQEAVAARAQMTEEMRVARVAKLEADAAALAEYQRAEAAKVDAVMLDPPPGAPRGDFSADIRWAYEQYENVVTEKAGLPSVVDLFKATEPPPSKGAIFLIRAAAKKPEKLIDLVFRTVGKTALEGSDDEKPQKGEDEETLENLADMVRKATGFDV